ncbi:MAG: hypothetical protein KIT81_04365 [Alphaproteobacteria bacterium]|nr:hypothetical protein [Alphaproteobacteria bacterium]
MPTTAYLAAEGFEAELAHELGSALLARHGRLFVAGGAAREPAWAANVWRDPREIEFHSIADGAARLRAIQRNWALYPHLHYRRARLIEARLPYVSAKPLVFPEPPPAAPLGSWTLLAPGRMLAAPDCVSPVPNGEWRFAEDRLGPPNRAYLKLWEILTRIGHRPAAGERCLDLGASPGGWSHVLAGLGAQVIAVDKAPLAPAVAAHANVEWRQGSAFATQPAEVGPIDWLFSDVICYPPRLLALVRRWIASGMVRHLVCTIKFQGETDHETAASFAAIPGARLMHLHANKHELTFVRL